MSDSDRIILILGGTGDAHKIATRLSEDPEIPARIILSLAGRTKNPVQSTQTTRSGGFGGKEGLATYLEAERISAVIDATHPFAAQITSHAIAACADKKIIYCRYERPPWKKQPGDIWHSASDISEAVRLAPTLGARIFLTTGSKDLSEFLNIKAVKIWARMVDLPDNMLLPPYVTPILARGPFDLEVERALLLEHKIDLLIAKNSGGNATIAKLVAARELKIPVIMVERPPTPPIYAASKISEIAVWLKKIIT